MKAVKFLFLAMLCILQTACQAGYTNTSSSRNKTDAGTDYSLLIHLDGEVQLKRKEWREFHSTSFGAILLSGDRIRPDKNIHAIVLCKDLSLWSLPPGEISGLDNGCKGKNNSILQHGPSLISQTRGVDDLIPYVIEPRLTRLLSPQPLLRWNNLPGVKTYTLKINTSSGETIWSAQAQGNEFLYPAQPLQPGVQYTLQVITDTGISSSDDKTPNLAFTVSSEDEADQIKLAVEVLRENGKDLSGEALDYAIAQIYTDKGYYAEAAHILEKLIAAGHQDASIFRSLGNIYQTVGLLRLAEEHYQKSTQLSDTMNDIEGSAESHFQLGEVYNGIGNLEKAQTEYKLALEKYQALGDPIWLQKTKAKIKP